MRSPHSHSPNFRPRLIAAAVASLLIPGISLASGGNANTITEGSLTGTQSEYTIPVSVPANAYAFSEKGISISEDGSLISGIIGGLTAGSSYSLFFKDGNGARYLPITYSGISSLTFSSDAKTILATVLDGSDQKLLLIKDTGTGTPQTTLYATPSAINGVSGYSVFKPILAADGSSFSANYTKGMYQQAGTYLNGSSSPIFLLSASNQYSDGSGLKTQANAMASTSSGARVVGWVETSSANPVDASYWDVSSGVSTVQATSLETKLTPIFTSIAANPWGRYSYADGISKSGNIITGNLNGNNGYAQGAFAYRVSDDTTFDLTVDNTRRHSTAGMSSDGKVIALQVGSSDAYVWTYNGSSYTSTNIGNLSNTYATVTAVSADGSAVIGRSNAMGFRWTAASGIQSVADWVSASGVSLAAGTTLTTADGVSGDGSVVVGVATDANRNSYYYLARVGGSAFGSGVINQAAFNATLPVASQQTIVLNQQLTNMSMYGAHHRAVMDNGMKEGEDCAWSTLDVGGGRDANHYLAEAGLCHDIGNWRFGVGMGVANGRQSYDFSGNTKLDGQFYSAEADYGWADRTRILSLTAIYGSWDTAIKRGYQNGSGTDISSGKADMTTLALRTRFDWKDFASFAGASLSPFISHTFTQTHLDGYTETGGGFPVRFDAREVNTHELRAGLVGKKALTGNADLRLTAEAVSIVSDDDKQIKGQVLGLNSFSLNTNKGDNNWGRLGAEIDYRISPRSLLSTSVTTSSNGRDVAYGGSVSLKMNF